MAQHQRILIHNFDRVLILKLDVFTGSNDVVFTKSSSLMLCVSLRVQKHYNSQLLYLYIIILQKSTNFKSEYLYEGAR